MRPVVSPVTSRRFGTIRGREDVSDVDLQRIFRMPAALMLTVAMAAVFMVACGGGGGGSSVSGGNLS